MTSGMSLYKLKSGRITPLNFLSLLTYFLGFLHNRSNLQSSSTTFPALTMTLS